MADKRDTSDGIPQARTPEQAADQPPEVADEADARKPAVEAAAAQVAAQPDTESRPDEGADAVPTRQVEQVASQPIPLSTSTVPGAWWDAAWEALRHPDQPPRRLAELAVAELGPRAAAWGAWLRRTYPDPPAHGIVRLAVHAATQAGRALALAEEGGPLLAPARLVGAAWVRATLVLRVAAAYGHDPTDPQRVDDLIEVCQLDPEATGDLFPLARISGGAGQLGLLRAAVSRFTWRKGPGAQAVRALFAASEYTDQLTKLAYRAVRHYRPGSAANTEASSASSSS